MNINQSIVIDNTLSKSLSEDIKINRMHTVLDSLILQYKDNSIITKKLENFIINQLPIFLQENDKKELERKNRKKKLINVGDQFINDFIENSNIYYCTRKELFYHYNELHFNIYNEDDIHYQALQKINHNNEIKQWKYKIKNSIVKRLKERNILDMIPSNKTIMYVSNYLISEFKFTKTSAIYFLCSIGDCINGIRENIYIVPPVLKILIRELETAYYDIFGKHGLLSNFKFKHHEHSFYETRFFNLDLTLNTKSINDKFLKNIIDLFCVAKYYQNKYQTADEFLKVCNDTILKSNALFTINLTHDKLVKDFIENALIVSDNSYITEKNIIFILKKYLKDKNIPNIIFQDTFIEILKKNLKYNSEKNYFINITSLYLPVVIAFTEFWKVSVEESTDKSYINGTILLETFIKYIDNTNYKHKTSNITLSLLIDILKYKFPDVIISDNNIIQNYKLIV